MSQEMERFNGYEIADAKARTEIEKLKKESFSKINLVNNIIYDTNSNLYTQGICINGNELYVYQNINDTIGNLLVFDIANYTLLRTIENIQFYHGGDLVYENNIIYCATSGNNKKICNLDLSTNIVTEIDPFSILTQFTETIGMGNFDENNLIVLLGTSPFNNFDNKGLYLLNKNTNEITELSITNTNNFNLNFYCFQAMDYKDNNLYCLVSEPNMLIKLVNTNNVFNIEKIYNIPTFDSLGLQIGEVEGIGIIENKRFVLTSHIQNNNVDNYKTLKTYIFDLETELQNPERRTDNLYNGDVLFRTEIICNSNANQNIYYENGTPDFPFKDLKRAISYINNSPFAIGKQIGINPGNYKIGKIVNMEANIICRNVDANNKVYIDGQTTIVNSNIIFNGSTGESDTSSNMVFNNRFDADGGSVEFRYITFEDIINVMNNKLHIKDCNFNDTDREYIICIQQYSECISSASTFANEKGYYYVNKYSRLFVNETVPDSKITKNGRVFIFKTTTS